MDLRLDDAELAQLFQRLDVSEEWTLGFFVALVTGPEPIEAEVWLPYVAGSDKFGDDATAEANLGTLAKLFQAVSFQIRHDVGDVTPEPDDERAVKEYCRGFVRGAKLHKRWLADEMGVATLRIMNALAGDADEPSDPEWKSSITDRVGALFAHFHPKPKPVTVEKRIGRNDPCPCGSGKKYKKCCGKNEA